MITKIKNQIIECEKEVLRFKELLSNYPNPSMHPWLAREESKLSTLQSCLALAEETKEKLKEELRIVLFNNSECQCTRATDKYSNLADIIIEKTFGGKENDN